MAEHWLRTAAARDLPLAKVLSMSEEQAYCWLYRARWGDGEPSCVHCGVVDAYRLRRNGKRINRFKCRNCGREFTVTLQTIFADRKLSFRKMLAIIALHVHSVKDKAGLQDCREVGVCYPSAWVMLMKIREAVADSEPQELLDDVVEIDGAYVGGYQRPDMLAMEPDGRHLSVDVLAHELGDLSRHNLHKIVQDLTSLGVTRTVWGAGGGVLLARLPGEIHIGELVRRLETDQAVVECFRIDGGSCSLMPDCRLRSMIGVAQRTFYEALDQNTLAYCLPPRPKRTLSSTSRDQDQDSPRRGRRARSRACRFRGAEPPLDQGGRLA
jgi:Rrf2 family transcriptional regulator, nitric oxide-sensitive transcriptional repressor